MTKATTSWLPVIGLEVHAQMQTPAKLFSAARSSSSKLSDSPNSNVALFDAAFPGTLPSLNHHCVRLAIKSALALNANINRKSWFDRKHYFYPDLPHGYQITQHFKPFAKGGFLDLTKFDGAPEEKRYRIQQIQIEQDSGKLMTPFPGSPEVLVDLNRAGVGVLEIVTEPDFNSADEVVAFMKKMQRLLWHTGVSSADMDEGVWRCDINISVKKVGSIENGVRTELKHVSKFSVVKTAIEFEVARQIALLESGQQVLQETMGLDENGHTKRLRGKEDAPDYRYMPEPDLPALIISEKLIDHVGKRLPESLDVRRDRLEKQYGLSMFHISVLMDEPGAVEYYEELTKNRDQAKTLNWLISNLFAMLNKHGIKLAACPIPPSEFGPLIDLVDNGSLSGIRGKDVLAILFDDAISGANLRRSARDIALQNDWLISQESKAESEKLLDTIIDGLIAKHANLVKEIQAGQIRKLKFFSGQVMAATKGKADPVLVDSLLKSRILPKE
ncbi:Asp/Glu-ADT subunit B [Chytriomyces cf. hyalinus JEL632]|nr:Asp/Glu-ADT subunit B [Chytriomyces cf. hyalinus JEL632]